ncbi:hypothetical protein BZA70DRAFT_291727 [Myxozyma melibiosi]|uniref:Uncharacterized protein n=1 Tax=Myxozyma melibiosi TaxID=54550 RepID=A0ABR1EZ89_9ASCO
MDIPPSVAAVLHIIGDYSTDQGRVVINNATHTVQTWVYRTSHPDSTAVPLWKDQDSFDDMRYLVKEKYNSSVTREPVQVTVGDSQHRLRLPTFDNDSDASEILATAKQLNVESAIRYMSILAIDYDTFASAEFQLPDSILEEFGFIQIKDSEDTIAEYNESIQNWWKKYQFMFSRHVNCERFVATNSGTPAQTIARAPKDDGAITKNFSLDENDEGALLGFLFTPCLNFKTDGDSRLHGYLGRPNQEFALFKSGLKNL